MSRRDLFKLLAVLLGLVRLSPVERWWRGAQPTKDEWFIKGTYTVTSVSPRPTWQLLYDREGVACSVIEIKPRDGWKQVEPGMLYKFAPGEVQYDRNPHKA